MHGMAVPLQGSPAWNLAVGSSCVLLHMSTLPLRVCVWQYLFAVCCMVRDTLHYRSSARDNCMRSCFTILFFEGPVLSYIVCPRDQAPRPLYQADSRQFAYESTVQTITQGWNQTRRDPRLRQQRASRPDGREHCSCRAAGGRSSPSPKQRGGEWLQRALG